jgi:adenylate cyclase
VKAGNRDRFLRALAAASGGSVVAALVLFTGVADLYEAKTLDWRFKALARPNRADSSVVLVLLDQKSLDFYEEEEGIPWPWPRQMYQPVVDYCRMAGARGVAFDVIFSEPSFYSPQDDSALGDAMARAGNVTLGVPLTRLEGGTEPPPKLFLPVAPPERTLPAYIGAQMPIAVLSSAVGVLGSVTFLPDNDGVYRSMAHLVLCGGRIVPSLPLALLLAAHPPEDVEVREGELRVRGNLVPVNDRGETSLYFWGPVTAYRQFSMASIIQSYLRVEEGLDPVVPPELLQGAYVLVGFSAPGLYDLRPVPLGGAYPGVAIHATALDNLLNGDFLRRVPAWVALLAAIAAAMAVAFIASATKRLWLVGLAFLAILALVLGASFVMFRMLWWLQLVALLAAVSVSFLGTVLANFAAERKEKRFLRTAFSHYLNPGMVEEIVRNPSLLRLGGERREMTVHFSDIAGFTTIAEGMEPSELTEMLNTYLSEMTDIILDSGGTLDKYEGDAIIAFWGAPLEQPDHPLRACRAVLACRVRLAELQGRFEERGWPALRVRVGVSSGPMVVGNMGSLSRFDYTVVGDNVNLAARLEGANKVFGTDILVSDETHRIAGDEVIWREVALLRVKGKRQAVAVYQPMALRADVDDETMELVLRHNKALAMFRSRHWGEAAELFDQLPEDPLSQWYSAQCRRFEAAPPPRDWDAVVALETK